MMITTLHRRFEIDTISLAMNNILICVEERFGKGVYIVPHSMFLVLFGITNPKKSNSSNTTRCIVLLFLLFLFVMRKFEGVLPSLRAAVKKRVRPMQNHLSSNAYLSKKNKENFIIVKIETLLRE